MVQISRGFLFVILFATSAAAADDGDDFVNNLFSDLAPLLALFGERVTMQFISQSIGWADNIVLAMAPIGIITIIVSAIRVGGPGFLKALIGRARENLAVAEQELMSSTSSEVCELWNGHEVVRCMGSAPIKEFICLLPDPGGKTSDNQIEVRVMPFEEVLNRQLHEIGEKQFLIKSLKIKPLRELLHKTLSLNSSTGRAEDKEKAPGSDSVKPLTPAIIVTQNPHSYAPNITLNSHDLKSRAKLRSSAALGIIIQLGLVAYAACSVYHPALSFPKDGKPVARYAFFCHAIGTVFLVLGMLVCAHVVESSTEETELRPEDDCEARLVWLQQTKTVNDQSFESSAIYAKTKRTTITTSKRKRDATKSLGLSNPPPGQSSVPAVHPASDEAPAMSLEVKTIIGTVFSLCGYIVQFIGLRGLHWSTSIAQLGAILFMTGVRAWVRRHLADPPSSLQTVSGHELDWFATTFADVQNAPWLVGKGTKPDAGIWRIGRLEAHVEEFKEVNELNESVPNSADCTAHRAVTIRTDLARLAKWQGPTSAEAISLARSIEATMNLLFHDREEKHFTWSLSTPEKGLVQFNLDRKNGKWTAYSDEVEAALSLWVFSASNDENGQMYEPLPQSSSSHTPLSDAHKRDDSWLRAEGSRGKPGLRLLGSYEESLHRDLSWWLPSDSAGVLRLTMVGDSEKQTERLEVGSHRIVGSLDSGPVPEQLRSKTNQYEVMELEEFSIDMPLSEDDEKEEEQSKSRSVSVSESGDDQGTDAGADSSKDLLAVEFNGPLKLLYAQDIFSSFFWAAASSLKKPLIGLPKIATSSDEAGQSFSLHHERLSELAQSIQSTGLGSLGDVYLGMIPSLSTMGKLPQATTIVELARRHAEPHEKLQRWKEAGDEYICLYRVAKTFPPKSRFNIQATAILLEFLRQVDEAMTMRKAEQKVDAWYIMYRRDDTFDQLEKLKRTLESELFSKSNKDEARTIVKDLLYLFAEQERPLDIAFEINLDFGASYDYPEEFGLTALHQAELKNDSLRIEGDVNAEDVLGWTPLHLAVQLSRVWRIQGLLQSDRTNINARTLLGWTPLHYACNRRTSNDTSIITLLLKEGADIDAQGRDGVAPIHCAARMGYLQAVMLLTEGGANIDSLDASRRTPLLWAVFYGHQETVEYLWSCANKTLRDSNGRTALHLAVLLGHEDIAQWLIENGADVQAIDRRKCTPLHQAAWNGQQTITKLLCRKCPEAVNTTDNTKQTPLHRAAGNGQKEVVKWLVEEAGADVDAKADYGRTPLHMAARYGHKEVVKWLVKEAKANVDAKDGDGWTPLHWAARNGHEEVVKWLVEEAKANVDALDHRHETPLFMAAHGGHEEVVKWLVEEAKANVNALDDFMETPLFKAVEKERANVINFLLGKNPNLETRNVFGYTPLEKAAEKGNEAIAELLLKAGARDSGNRDGEGVVNLAGLGGRDENKMTFANLLEKYQPTPEGPGNGDRSEDGA